MHEVFERLPDCTVLMGVPTFYTRLLSLPALTPDYVNHVRLFISGSAPLTEVTFREWKEKTGVEILERYGMSETIINTSNPLDGERVAGTVGFLCRASISGFRTLKERSSLVGDRNHRGVRPGGDEGLLENAEKTKEEIDKTGTSSPVIWVFRMRKVE